MSNKIRQTIKNRGLKIADIIAKTGLSKSYFYDVMNCNSVPSLEKARIISEAIGVPLDELFPKKTNKEAS